MIYWLNSYIICKMCFKTDSKLSPYHHEMSIKKITYSPRGLLPTDFFFTAGFPSCGAFLCGHLIPFIRYECLFLYDDMEKTWRTLAVIQQI